MILKTSPSKLSPTQEADWYDSLRLLRSHRVGPVTFRRLLDEYGSASAALTALPDIAGKAGLKGYRLCPPAVIDAELKIARRIGAKLIFEDDPRFPANLKSVEGGPVAIWCLGRIEMLERPRLAVVGARNASSLGQRMAKALTKDLGQEGFVIVSGLARGIDTVAHQTALPHGTIAVQAGGLDRVYPAQNTDLAKEIATHGLRISEQPLGTEPAARHFPARNRIISGLSEGVIVIEAAQKSGSLITARYAADQGRDVFAVPGHPYDARSAGCNCLLRDGAILTRSAADILEHIQIKPPTKDIPKAVPTQTQTAVSEKDLLNRLSVTPLGLDDLARDLNWPVARLLPIVQEMELAGTIERHPGNMISKVE